MSLWRWLAALASRLAATIRHRHLDRDLDDELAFHLAMKQERLAADGVSAEEAARHAQRRLGNVTRLKEELREVWTFPSLESIGQDLAYALRGLRQQRGFTATVVVVLASVIGLNTTLFTVLAGVALRPWPGITDPSRVLRLYLADPSGHFAGLSLADARSLQQHATALAGVAMMKNTPVRVGRADGATASEALLVSGSFFDVLGVQMARGRGFVDTEDQLGAPVPVVIVSFAYWQSHLRGDPDVVGSTLTINDTVFTVVGIVAAAFGSAEPAYDKDLFLPMAALALLKPDDPSSQTFLYDPNVCCVDVVVRLSPRATTTTAHAELSVLASRFQLVFRQCCERHRPDEHRVSAAAWTRRFDAGAGNSGAAERGVVAGVADRVCERRQPVFVTSGGSVWRDRDAARARRESVACRPSARDRGPRAGADGWCSRRRRRASTCRSSCSVSSPSATPSDSFRSV